MTVFLQNLPLSFVFKITLRVKFFWILIKGVTNPDLVLNIGVILETRIGLKTIERKRITALGVKRIGKVQWNFKAYYL